MKFGFSQMEFISPSPLTWCANVCAPSPVCLCSYEGQRWKPDFLASYSPPYLLRQRLLLGPEFAISDGLCNPRAPEILFHLLCWGTSHSTYDWLVCRCWRYSCRSLCRCDNHFTTESSHQLRFMFSKRTHWDASSSSHVSTGQKDVSDPRVTSPQVEPGVLH